MADEMDRKIMPEFLQTAFAVSLGAAYKSFEMMMSPMESANKMFSEAKTLLSIPPDAGDGVQQKAEAVAGVWMDKGMTLMETCKTAGEKFTEGK
jgi:hypothetical protein